MEFEIKDLTLQAESETRSSVEIDMGWAGNHGGRPYITVCKDGLMSHHISIEIDAGGDVYVQVRAHREVAGQPLRSTIQLFGTQEANEGR